MISTNLPDAEWQHAEGLKKVLAALGDAYGGPRYVGGAVRDTLLGLPVADVDIATALEPMDVIDRLQAGGIKAIPTGIEHGTVTAAISGKNYEITTLRRDVTTDGRRATVAFATDWHEDAARRDFTINALYADPKSGEIFDYFNGLEDLQARRLRFIGDANQRIAEDFLRILRYFRFLARYGSGQLDTDAIAACAKGAHGLTALSRERIAQELTRILSLRDPVLSIELMITHGIFTPFLPELSDSAAIHLQSLIKREQQFAQIVSLPARFLALLNRDAVAVDKVAARLKLSNKLREGLAQRLIAPSPQPDNVRAMAYHADIGTARDLVMLYGTDSDVPECLAQLQQWEIPSLNVKGGDLIKLGLTAGPMVAKTLQAIEAAWIDEGFPDIQRQNELASQTVHAALSETKNA